MYVFQAYQASSARPFEGPSLASLEQCLQMDPELHQIRIQKNRLRHKVTDQENVKLEVTKYLFLL